MLVFISKLLQSTIRWVQMCQGFSHISASKHFVFIKLATSIGRSGWEKDLSVSIVCITSPLRWPSWCLRCLPSQGGSSSPVLPGPPTPSPDPGASQSQPPEPEHNNNNSINLGKYKAEKVCSRNIVSISDNQIRIIMEITKTYKWKEKNYILLRKLYISVTGAAPSQVSVY